MTYNQAVKQACARAIESERDFSVCLTLAGDFVVRDTLDADADDAIMYLAENCYESAIIAGLVP